MTAVVEGEAMTGAKAGWEGRDKLAVTCQTGAQATGWQAIDMVAEGSDRTLTLVSDSDRLH